MKKFACILLALTILPQNCADRRANYQDATHFVFLGGALNDYLTVNKKMPGNITDKEGKPLLSWRVELLTVGGDRELNLYKQFKLDEPWNSQHNMKVAQTVPFMYIDPKGPKCTPLSSEQIEPMWRMNPEAPNYTPYLGVTGRTAAFRPNKPRDIDPKDSHAAIVVVDKSDVFWTEPRDIPLEKAKKGDSLRYYGGDMIRYLSTRGADRFWDKGRIEDGENQPPVYEYEEEK